MTDALGGLSVGHSQQWQYVAVPNAVPTVSRRRVLVGTAALALFGSAVSACSSPPSRDPALDLLTEQLNRARTDSTLAAAAATAATPKLVAALTAVASIRSAHAQALSDEIARIASTAPTTTTTPSTTAATAAAAPPPSVQDVITSLQQSADTATQVAAGQSGYRAGLLASIAAACTAAHSIELATS